MRKMPVFQILTLAILAAALIPQADAQGIDAAIELYEHGKFQGAEELFSNLSRRAPNDANLQIWLGKTHLKLHRRDDAVLAFKKAVALDAKNGAHHLWLARAYGEKAAHAFLSAFSLAIQARKEFETAAELAPDNLDIRFDLLEYYAQAPGFLGGGKEKAMAQAEEIAKRAPRAGYTARAGLFAQDEKWESAQQELLQATVKFPNDPSAHLDLADFQLQRRDFKGAEAGAQRALALDGANRRARLLLAAARIELGRNLDESLMALQELAAGVLTEHDPAFEDVHYWIGRAYLARGQKAEARQAFQTALSFDPDHGRSKAALAQIKRLP
jgi:predicted Zn-dependent protease